CARLGNRFTSSSTISPPTKLRRSTSSSNNIRESGFTSHPRTRPGSTRSRSGSPRSNARSSPAASAVTNSLRQATSGLAGTAKVLYTFTGGLDGGQPYQAGVVFDQAGNLYGVTQYGGAYGQGTVF